MVKPISGCQPWRAPVAGGLAFCRLLTRLRTEPMGLVIMTIFCITKTEPGVRPDCEMHLAEIF